MDMVYFDGSEGLAAMGSEQIPISMMELDFFSRLSRDVRTLLRSTPKDKCIYVSHQLA
jgi:hypothetical protein